jgi:hypothetical protein
VRRDFGGICHYLFNEAKDRRVEFVEPWIQRLLKVVCAGAVETLGFERTLELLDQQRERLISANLVALKQSDGELG